MMIKRVFRFFVFVLLLGAAPGLYLLMNVEQTEVAQARAQYDAARQDLDTLTEQLNHSEARLRNLTSDVRAVEEQVRRQLRMVRPGETLVLIERE